MLPPTLIARTVSPVVLATPMPRTILFVHPSDELYGSDRCLLEIVRGLPEIDRAIVVLPTDFPYDGALSRELLAAGARIERVNMLVLRRAMLSPRQAPLLFRRMIGGALTLARLIRGYDVDLVHSNTLAVVCGAIASRLCRRPHLWHVHEHIGDEPAPYRALIRFLLLVSPGLIVANSRPVARTLVGGSKRRLARIRVVENSVRPDIRFVDRSGRDVAMPVVIGVMGRLSPRKGIGEAIQAAAILAQRGEMFSLRFVGAVPPGRADLWNEYQRLVSDLGLEDYVIFAGESLDVQAELDRFDILLLPSQRPEPFGLVVIEGMASGLPVVATLNGGGSDDFLDHGKTGFYSGRDSVSIAAALELLIRDRDLRLQTGKVAATVASRRYSRQRYLEGFSRLYDRLSPRLG